MFRSERNARHPRNIVVVYLDPSNFKNIGDGHTIADQINEVLVPYGLGAIPASNDRVGGAQLGLQWLARGQWLISDTCPMLASALSSRVHDPKKPGDVLNVAGDPLDEVYDSARYGLHSFVTASEKPIEVKRSEVVAQFAEKLHDGSLSVSERGAVMTSSLIRDLQLKAEEAVGGRPIRLGRRSW
jgi:hypothetical protein